MDTKLRTRTATVQEAAALIKTMVRTASTHLELNRAEALKAMLFVVQDYICEIIPDKDDDSFRKCLDPIWQYMERKGL